MEEVVAGEAHDHVALGHFVGADDAGGVLLSDLEVFFQQHLVDFRIGESFQLFLADLALEIVVS